MNFPIFVPKGEVKRILSPLRRHILTVGGNLKKYNRTIWNCQKKQRK